MVIRLTMNMNSTNCMTTIFLYSFFLGIYWNNQCKTDYIPPQGLLVLDYILLKM